MLIDLWGFGNEFNVVTKVKLRIVSKFNRARFRNEETHKNSMLIRTQIGSGWIKLPNKILVRNCMKFNFNLIITIVFRDLYRISFHWILSWFDIIALKIFKRFYLIFIGQYYYNLKSY